MVVVVLNVVVLLGVMVVVGVTSFDVKFVALVLYDCLCNVLCILCFGGGGVVV